MSSRERSTNEQDWDDELDLPRWSSSDRRQSQPDSRDDQAASRKRSGQRREPYREAGETPSGQRRSPRNAAPLPDFPEPDPGFDPTHPPSDYPNPQRSRRRSYPSESEQRPARQGRRARANVEDEAFGAPADDWTQRGYSESDEIYAPPSRRRPAPSASSAEPRRRRSSRAERERRAPSVAIPRPAVPDGTLAAIVGGTAVGIVLMAITLAARIGDLPDWIPIHLNASGDPDQWGSPNALWRIPLAVVMCTVMSLIVAALIWKRDAFAARFLVGSSVLIQILAWVAVIDALW